MKPARKILALLLAVVLPPASTIVASHSHLPLASAREVSVRCAPPDHTDAAGFHHSGLCPLCALAFLKAGTPLTGPSLVETPPSARAAETSSIAAPIVPVTTGSSPRGPPSLL